MSNPSKEICGFEFISKHDIPMTDITLFFYRHKVHGCPFIYLQTKDPHNFFSCTLRTPPINNCGITHMLEHLVFNGSTKYPVRSIITEMKKRSCATFLGGFTFSDLTTYPFSTYNKQDYFNLLDVFLESIFHPLLNEIDFMNECFHQEFEDNDQTKQLIYGGIVYNEMKGQFSDQNERTFQILKEKFLPDSPDRFYSVGLPNCIPKAKIKDVREYHSKYYHPSNATFYHYGSIPSEEVFEKVNEIISTFSVCDLKFDMSILKQPKWSTPKEITIDESFNSANKDKTRQNQIFFSYLSESYKDINTYFDVKFLTALLLWGSSSPIGKLTGVSTIPIECVNDQLYNAYICFSLYNLSDSDILDTKYLVHETLLKCYTEGFDQQRYESVIHKFEMDLRETSDYMGYKYYNKILFSTCYGLDPHKCLDINFFLDTIQSNLKKNPKYYQDLIKPLFIDNTHKLTMIVKPVDGFVDKINDKINKDLEKETKNLSQNERNRIIENYNKLKELHIKQQQQQQEQELLPSLKKSDIKLLVEDDENYEQIDENISINLMTLNGMTYIDFYLKIDFKHPLIDYIPLFTFVITRVGAGEMNDEQIDSFINLNCSGIKISIDGKADLDDYTKGYAQITISTHCLDKDIGKTIDILKKVLFEPHLNHQHQIKILTSNFIDIIFSNFKICSNDLLSLIIKSSLTDSCAIDNVMKGSYQIQFLNKLIEKNDWNDVCKKLQKVHKEIFLRAKAQCSIMTTEKNSISFDSIKSIVDIFNNNSNKQKYSIESPVDKNIFKNYKNVYVGIDSCTNFTAIACKIVSFNDEKSPLFSVLCEILKNEYLNNSIRLEIGAYDVFCFCDLRLGIFEINSFRDPNPLKCLEAFKKAICFCSCEDNINDSIVDRAIINVLGCLGPNDISQKRRDIIYNAKKEQIIEIAKLIKENDWNCGILSNPNISKSPKGYTFVNLIEFRKTKKLYYVLLIIALIFLFFIIFFIFKK